MKRARFFSRSSDMGLMCLSTKSRPVGLGLAAGAAPFGACASPVGGRDADSSHGSSLLPAQPALRHLSVLRGQAHNDNSGGSGASAPGPEYLLFIESLLDGRIYSLTTPRGHPGFKENERQHHQGSLAGGCAPEAPAELGRSCERLERTSARAACSRALSASSTRICSSTSSAYSSHSASCTTRQRN